MTAAVARQWLEQGVSLQQRRDFVGAERCYQTVLRAQPDNADALNLLGTLALEARRFDVAAGLFRRALQLLPNHPGFSNNLGVACLETRQFPEAAAALETSLANHPRQAEAMVGLARAYQHLNRGTEGLSLLRQALNLAPGHHKATFALAGLLVNIGEDKEAVRQYRILIQRGRDLPRVLAAMAPAHRFTPDDPEPALIERLLVGDGLDDDERAMLLHALGKARADLADPAAAFAAFSTAKSLAGRQFDLEAHATYYEVLREEMTPDYFAQRRDYGLDSEQPVFIVGMPRSGTTLAEQICSSHPDVTGIGEVPSMSHLLKRLGWRSSDPGRLRQVLQSITSEQTRHLASAYLDDTRHYGGTRIRVIDKVPHNFQYLGLIALLFPKARIIHCRRDPVDNCVSCFTHSFHEVHGYNADLNVMGRYYRSYDRLMAHWREVLPLRMFECRYESLVADQEGESRRLIDFLDLDWDDACLTFFDNDRPVLTPSRWQVRQPIYRSSVRAWEKYRPYLGPLFDGLGDLADTGDDK